MSLTALVAEIKELKEKKQKENDIITTIAARIRQPLVPQIEYEYSDISVHEDLHKLIEFSCTEVCSTKEQLNKIMKFWTMFFEPLLGVPSLPCGTQSSKDTGNAISPAVKCQSSSNREDSDSPDADTNRVTTEQPKSLIHDCDKISAEQVNICKSSATDADSVAKEGRFVDLL